MWIQIISFFKIQRKKLCYDFFTSKIPTENATVIVYLTNLVNLINKSFTTRCLKRITEYIASNDSQGLNHNFPSKIEKQNRSVGNKVLKEPKIVVYVLDSNTVPLVFKSLLQCWHWNRLMAEIPLCEITLIFMQVNTHHLRLGQQDISNLIGSQYITKVFLLFLSISKKGSEEMLLTSLQQELK